MNKFVLNTMMALTIHQAPAYTNAANPKKRSFSIRAERGKKELKRRTMKSALF